VRLLRSFFSDVGLWGLAVVFGWAIWYVVREDLNETQRRQVDVVFEPDAGLDVEPHVLQATIEVQGPRRAVDAFRTTVGPRIVRRVTTADVPQGVDDTRLDFGKDDFDFSPAFSGAPLTVVEMSPPVVGVRVFRVEVQDKTIAPPEFPGAAELGVKHSLIDYTNTAKVRGAVAALSTFREIRTFVSRDRLQAATQAMRDEARSTQRIQLEIDPAQREHFVLVEPRELSAHVELSRVARQELVVPIQIFQDVASGGRRKLQFAEINKPFFVGGARPTVKLQVTGVLSSLATLTPGRIRAFVLESDLPDDQRNGDVPIHVADLPPGVALAEEYGVYVEEGR
jgi:hypothetical protein